MHVSDKCRHDGVRTHDLFVSWFGRSQRDTAGEREQRQREQEELQAQLGQLQADLREVGQRRRVAEEAMEQLKDRQRQHK